MAGRSPGRPSSGWVRTILSADMTRAVLDGLAPSVLELAEAVESVVLAGPRRVHRRGSIRDTRRVQHTTDALGVSAAVPVPDTATSVGAGMLAWAAAEDIPVAEVFTPRLGTRGRAGHAGARVAAGVRGAHGGTTSPALALTAAPDLGTEHVPHRHRVVGAGDRAADDERAESGFQCGPHLRRTELAAIMPAGRRNPRLWQMARGRMRVGEAGGCRFGQADQRSTRTPAFGRCRG